MSKTYGGKNVYGASVGILMLETRFPRIPGDIGNALTWPFPVHYRAVRGATLDNVVRGAPLEQVGKFVDAARDLVAIGCDGITTNCGFLSLLQDELAEALDVPVASSSLMQVPMIEAILLPSKHTSILTISAETLTPAHLRAARVPQNTPVVGTDRGRAFTRDVLNDAVEIDFEACRQDMLDASDTLLSNHPDTGAIVLECTNMVPYAADIRRETGLPVYSIYSFVTWFQAGLFPRRFEQGIFDTGRRA